ncbi:GrpB-like predicted nucleotidyltransferase (UPF0157 family) [Paucibacter oligotrophus]|uniref:GrpB-like predicted nucleotidyltransferase (UPF0157 family) n=1 Tax=Roseateles oligotrophus TaxID=1769250 RepID=A0A840LLR1_9BURK|nr:GrpB family protein [Roseateles oligotrophus]MBB4846247.1 GrpB-like predicted nucleotidyltransferase (UPF0157 family) [Roseateles oligotrophus]
MPITLLAHKPEWPQAFAAEAARLSGLMADEMLALHHIGSTAIPGISAKPIIDMLMVVRDVDALDRRAQALLDQGYEAMGEYGIAGRRYFRKSDGAGRRSHHLHCFAAGSAEVGRHLAFRDYLRSHPDEAQAYGLLKQALAQRFADDEGARYVEGKTDFIRQVLAKAAGPSS